MMASMVTIVSPINFTFYFAPKIQYLSLLMLFDVMSLVLSLIGEKYVLRCMWSVKNGV